ncbi:MAG: HD-GYP domain-containing protein [Halioglobus sp.]|nr:HD-GYP domain-containing protein [Halioglobus sp.]
MLKTLKVTTTDLEIGMYVSGLDRPWLGTPFATQGFFIQSAQEIEQLCQYCDYVLVDSRRSVKSSSHRRRATVAQTRESASPQNTDSPPADAYGGRKRIPPEKIFYGRAIHSYRDDGSWEEEEPRARRALDSLIEDVGDIFEEVGEGQKLDVVRLRKAVEPVVDSISRNPDACLWVARLKQHDRYTYKHSLGAAIWSVALGRQLGLSRHDLRSLSMGCMLMDVGKLRVDPALLQAERELDAREMAEVAGHVNHGVEIVRESGLLNRDVLDMVAHHHERFDGSGYPNGLRHNEIPPCARIAGIVDTYDAITSKRSYASAMAPSEAIKHLYMTRDTDFQAELVEAFIQAIGIYPAGTLVELSSGEVGVVVAEYRIRRLRPKVMLLLDAQKRRLRKSKIVDLQQECGANGEPLLSIRRSLEPESYGIDLTEIAV